MILIGYSGHSFVAAGILQAAGKKLTGYCDLEEKSFNPYKLEYFGKDSGAEGMEKIRSTDFFIAIGDNGIRKKLFHHFETINRYPVNAIHPSAIIDPTAAISSYGVMICAGVCINPFATIGNGVICNTGCIIEHECRIGSFAHIAPGAVLCGNVEVGDGSFIGAGSVVRQGIKIGKNVMVGAGSVVVKNIEDNQKVVGNPSRIFKK